MTSELQTFGFHCSLLYESFPKTCYHSFIIIRYNQMVTMCIDLTAMHWSIRNVCNRSRDTQMRLLAPFGHNCRLCTIKGHA
eukprot:2132807-Amphidinium_carterae.2